MNILYVGNYNFQAQTAPVHRVTSNAKIFLLLGHKVVHLSQGDTEYIDSDGCQHYFFSKAGNVLSVFQRHISVNKIIDVMQKECIDTVILYNYHSVAMYRLWKYCRKKRIRIVADVTEWYQFYSLRDKMTKGLDTFFRMRVIHPRLDGLIVISTYLEEYYKKAVKSIVKIPPLIDYENEKWIRNDATLSDRPSLLSIATSDIHKDNVAAVVRLLECVVEMKDAPDFYLDIVGMTEEQYMQSFDSAGISSSLREHVCFCGRIPHDEVLKIEKKAWYNIFIREDNVANNAGFPSKAAESLACGTPIITNDTSNIFEYVRDGYTGFMLHGNRENQAIILYRALKLGKTEVEKMHFECQKEHIFDQNNYHDQMTKFFERKE